MGMRYPGGHTVEECPGGCCGERGALWGALWGAGVGWGTRAVLSGMEREVLCLGKDLSWFGGGESEGDPSFPRMREELVTPPQSRQRGGRTRGGRVVVAERRDCACVSGYAGSGLPGAWALPAHCCCPAPQEPANQPPTCPQGCCFPWRGARTQQAGHQAGCALILVDHVENHEFCGLHFCQVEVVLARICGGRSGSYGPHPEGDRRPAQEGHLSTYWGQVPICKGQCTALPASWGPGTGVTRAPCSGCQCPGRLGALGLGPESTCLLVPQTRGAVAGAPRTRAMWL